ncbi:hypothetical protein ACG2LH_05805 [Zhouia sp. PK063]|uniref:hypothetical protein n=1 Tax=Zhouia sp. PK063 TaxID=3373602 RepID=UPI00379770A2
MIRIFATSVTNSRLARKIEKDFLNTFIVKEVNFDLEDRDNIFRVDTAENEICAEKVKHFFRMFGIQAFELED